MVSSVEDFGVSPMQEIFSTNSNGQSSGRFLCQSNEQICPVEEQEGSFPWKSLSPEWLPILIPTIHFLRSIIITTTIVLNFIRLQQEFSILLFKGNNKPKKHIKKIQ